MSKGGWVGAFKSGISNFFGRGEKPDKKDKKRHPSDLDPPRTGRSESLLSASSSAAAAHPPKSGYAYHDSQREFGNTQDFDIHLNEGQPPYNERSVDEPRSPGPSSSGESAPGPVARKSSSLTRDKRQICCSFDRDRPDWLLRKAFDFVSARCEIELVFARDVHREHCSPLLVFCKNDTKLQEDMDNALKRNRGGDDVMLIVVTDRKDLRLVDTEASTKFGQKVCLIWDYDKKKFRYSENGKNLIWIRDFLEKFHFQVDIQLTRTASLRRSLKGATSGGSEKGYYHVLPPGVQEELLKKAIVFFNDQLVELQRAPDTESMPRPLIVFCDAGDTDRVERHVAQFMNKHRFDKRDLHVVVFCRGSQLRTYGQGSDFPTFLRIRVHDLRPELSDAAENKTLATTLKRFLKKNTRSDKTHKPDQSKSNVSQAGHSPGVIPTQFDYRQGQRQDEEDSYSSISDSRAMFQPDNSSSYDRASSHEGGGFPSAEQIPANRSRSSHGGHVQAYDGLSQGGHLSVSDSEPAGGERYDPSGQRRGQQRHDMDIGLDHPPHRYTSNHPPASYHHHHQQQQQQAQYHAHEDPHRGQQMEFEDSYEQSQDRYRNRRDRDGQHSNQRQQPHGADSMSVKAQSDINVGSSGSTRRRQRRSRASVQKTGWNEDAQSAYTAC